jgi:hypothetical protein
MAPWTVEFGCDVRPVRLDWLWRGYLARGKLALLEGDPEMGKSLLTIDLMARLSRGGPLPDETALPRPGVSVLLSAEDDLGDTVLPRAEAAGADLLRLLLPRFAGRLPRFPDDLPALEGLVRDSGAELLVIDPLMAFLPPKVATGIDQCVRQALTPLAELAGRTRCAVLAVRHLTKKPGDRAILRGQGSMGIVAAARTALFAAPHPDDAGLRVLTVAKSNVGVRPPALGYRIREANGLPVIEWTGPVGLTADGLCEKRKRPAELGARERVADWLKRELAAGPRPAGAIYAAAAAAGIPERTLWRAKKEIPVKSHRAYDAKANRCEWYWYDPDAPWPKKAPFSKPFELPPLGEM